MSKQIRNSGRVKQNKKDKRNKREFTVINTEVGWQVCYNEDRYNKTLKDYEFNEGLLE